MTDDINAVAKAIKHCLDIKDFANNATLANAAIETLKSLGWTPPTEREAIRAAMAKEVAEWHSKQIEEISRLLKHGNANSDGEIQMVMERIFHRTSHEAILALATMPQGYSVVETPREFICESCHLRIDEGVKPECFF
jgi:hypothetical protein